MQSQPPGEPIEWVISVPIFRNPVILRQLALVVGLPFGILMTVILLAAEGTDRLYALGLVALLFLLTFIFIMGVYGGKYDASFTIDAKGIRCVTQPGQAKKNAFINGLTVVLGLVTGKPAVAGAGMAAAAKQSVRVPWHHIRKVKFLPNHRTILVRGNPMETIAVFCTAENYTAVQRLIKDHQDRS